MIKRIITVIFVLVLSFSMTTISFASDVELIVVPSVSTVSKGEKFTVSVNVNGNQGICAAQFALAYDKSKLSCDAIKLGEVLRGSLSATNPSAKSGAIVAAASSTPLENDGQLAHFEFTALESLPSLSFSIEDVVLTGQIGNDLSYIVQQAIQRSDTPTSNVESSDPIDILEPEKGQIDSTVVKFTDVPREHWGASYIEKAVQLGLFNGNLDGTFRPDASISRAEFVVVLWRLAGSPEPTAVTPFTDVNSNAYYAKAVAWAYGNKYVDGTSSTTFSPAGKIRRQEAMKILFGYSGGQPGMELMFTGIYNDTFVDSNMIASWAKPAMYWGYYNGIISGIGNNKLSPTGEATRAQIAKILVNCVENQKI